MVPPRPRASDGRPPGPRRGRGREGWSVAWADASCGLRGLAGIFSSSDRALPDDRRCSREPRRERESGRGRSGPGPAGRTVRNRGRGRSGRDGYRLSRTRPQARPPGGPQGPSPGIGRRPGRGAIRPGDRDRGQALPPPHPSAVRLRRGRRASLLRHAVRGRGVPAGPPGPGGQAGSRRGRATHGPDRLGPQPPPPHRTSSGPSTTSTKRSPPILPMPWPGPDSRNAG